MTIRTIILSVLCHLTLTPTFAQNTTGIPTQSATPTAFKYPTPKSSAAGSSGFGFGTGSASSGGGGGWGTNGGAGAGGGSGNSYGGSGGGTGVSSGASGSGSSCTTGSCGGGAAVGSEATVNETKAAGSTGFGYGSGGKSTGGGGGFGANGGGGSGGGGGDFNGGTGGGAGASDDSEAIGSGATNTTVGGGYVAGNGVQPLQITQPGSTSDTSASSSAPVPIVSENIATNSTTLSSPTNSTATIPPPRAAVTVQPATATAEPVPQATPAPIPASALRPTPTPVSFSTNTPNITRPRTTAAPITNAPPTATRTPAPIVTAILPMEATSASDNSLNANSQVTSLTASSQNNVLTDERPRPRIAPLVAKHEVDMVVIDMNNPNAKKEIRSNNKQLPKLTVQPLRDQSKCYVKQERCCPVQYACGYSCHKKVIKVCKTAAECETYKERRCYPKVCVEDRCKMLGRIEGPKWTPAPAPTVHWNVIVTKLEKQT